VQVFSPRSDQRAACVTSYIKTSTKQIQRQAVVIGDSLLSRTEAPICRLDLLFREVCCLPGVCIRDVTGQVRILVQPSDYYPLQLFHMGTNDVAARSPMSIKRDFRAEEL